MHEDGVVTETPEDQAAKDRLSAIYEAGTRLRRAAEPDDALADLLCALNREAVGEVTRRMMTRKVRLHEATATVLTESPYREAYALATRIIEEEQAAPAPP
jgi:hypothetical protein